jgi:hypothetical protein
MSLKNVQVSLEAYYWATKEESLNYESGSARKWKEIPQQCMDYPSSQ